MYENVMAWLNVPNNGLLVLLVGVIILMWWIHRYIKVSTERGLED